MIRLGLVCSAGIVATGSRAVRKEKNFVKPSFVIHGRMSIREGSPMRKNVATTIANMIISPVTIYLTKEIGDASTRLIDVGGRGSTLLGI